MLSVVDQNKNVVFTTWNGTAWGAPSEQEIDAGTNRGQPFLFLWDQAPASGNAPPSPTLWLKADAGVPYRYVDGVID